MGRHLDEELIAAYRATEYRVFADPPFVMRIGERCAELEELLGRSGARGAAFVTAWNPHSEPTPLAINVARQAELVRTAEESGWRHLPGEGRGADPVWPPEPSILLIGADRKDVRALGRRFDQHAIVWLTPGEPAELDLL
jgi:hypothetical protein